jgi:hypothetical protein
MVPYEKTEKKISVRTEGQLCLHVMTGDFQKNRSVSLEGKCMVVVGKELLNLPIERSS